MAPKRRRVQEDQISLEISHNMWLVRVVFHNILFKKTNLFLYITIAIDLCLIKNPLINEKMINVGL